MERKLKALDFVRTPKGAIAMITEVSESSSGIRSFSINFIGPSMGEKNAWWADVDEITERTEKETEEAKKVRIELYKALLKPFTFLNYEGYDWENHENEKLEYLGNLPQFLAENLCHPFGSGKKIATETFK